MARRQRGSARFDPYFKVQWYDGRSFAWIDVQARHDSEAQARSEARALHAIGRMVGRYRVMQIAPEGRVALAEEDLDADTGRTPRAAAPQGAPDARPRAQPRARAAGDSPACGARERGIIAAQRQISPRYVQVVHEPGCAEGGPCTPQFYVRDERVITE